MDVKYRIWTFCFFVISGSFFVQAQNTYLYKRVMVVENGTKQNKNDDAHYITFTNKGCYESDKDGFTKDNGFVEYENDENGMHRYYGKCFYDAAYYYFSSDYSRLNIYITDNLIYVYQREPSGRTNATIRKSKPVIKEENVVIVPVPITFEGDSYESGISNSSSSYYIKCKSCRGTGNCDSCRGKGHSSKWGEKNQKCMGCNGSGRCSVCSGRGYFL